MEVLVIDFIIMVIFVKLLQWNVLTCLMITNLMIIFNIHLKRMQNG